MVDFSCDGIRIFAIQETIIDMHNYVTFITTIVDKFFVTILAVQPNILTYYVKVK